jgi:hypothetical protein
VAIAAEGPSDAHAHRLVVLATVAEAFVLAGFADTELLIPMAWRNAGAYLLTGIGRRAQTIEEEEISDNPSAIPANVAKVKVSWM